MSKLLTETHWAKSAWASQAQHFQHSGLSQSGELSNIYGVRASNYGKLRGCPAQGICLFFTPDLSQAIFWEANTTATVTGNHKDRLLNASLWSTVHKADTTQQIPGSTYTAQTFACSLLHWRISLSLVYNTSHLYISDI